MKLYLFIWRSVLRLEDETRVRGSEKDIGEIHLGICPWTFSSLKEFLDCLSITNYLYESERWFKNFFNYFNWRLIPLQYCSVFCHTLTWISHGCTCVSHPEPPSHIPPQPIPQGHPSTPALSTLYHASNLDWWFVSHMIMYMFQCHSPKLSHPRPLPQSPKDCSIHQCLVCTLLSRIQGYCYHLSKFHIYVLVYCIGVFLSDLLHSV